MISKAKIKTFEWKLFKKDVQLENSVIQLQYKVKLYLFFKKKTIFIIITLLLHYYYIMLVLLFHF